jgi:hypothetical protein
MDSRQLGVLVAGSSLVILAACGAQPGSNANLANSSLNSSNSRVANINTNNNSAGVGSSSSTVDAKEPERYQATVTLKVEALGGQQNVALPTLGATVARNADDRRMEIMMPAGGKIVFLDKGGTNYLVLPEKKQFAELNKESLGFEVRRLLMPEQIVAQVKGAPGIQLVGDENYNGRDAVKYRYGAVANTGTKAGEVTTDSFLIVDKQTGLPLHSETTSQSQSGANVQGYNGIRIITEITDIKSDTPTDMFEVPTDLQKIDSAQVRQQVDMVFSALAAFASQMMKQTMPSNANASTPAG